MENKLCLTCNTQKPSSEFYASSKKRCKECVRAKVKEYQERNREKIREKDHKRAMLPHRVAARKAYSRTDRGKEVVKNVKRKWQQSNQVKRAAHVILGNAVRDGKILKPDVCCRCGAGGRIHGHHHDYSLPLDVLWLCGRCHAAEHRELQRVARSKAA